MGIFEIVAIPEGVRPFGSQPVPTLIPDENELPEKFKARRMT